MEETEYQIFSKLNFSNAHDYTRNLKNLASGPKDLVLEAFNLSKVTDLFPYVEDFLNILIKIRLANRNLNLSNKDIENALNEHLSTPSLNRIKSKK